MAGRGGRRAAPRAAPPAARPARGAGGARPAHLPPAAANRRRGADAASRPARVEPADPRGAAAALEPQLRLVLSTDLAGARASRALVDEPARRAARRHRLGGRMAAAAPAG